MSIDKRISEFDIIEEFDITTKIPIIQGSPLKNGIITPKDFTKSIADDMLIELKLDNVDNTSDIDKPISTAQSTAIGLKADKTYVDNKVKTDVPVGAKFTDTIVDISGKADKTYVDEEIAILEARPLPDPMITLTEDEYHYLNPKDPNTYYFIKED